MELSLVLLVTLSTFVEDFWFQGHSGCDVTIVLLLKYFAEYMDAFGVGSDDSLYQRLFHAPGLDGLGILDEIPSSVETEQLDHPSKC